MVYVGWSEIETMRIIKSNLFAYTRDVKLIAKNRFPIPFGVFPIGLRRLSSDCKGRMARFRQICSTRTQIYVLLFTDFVELLHLGFKMVVIQASCLLACKGDTSVTNIWRSICQKVEGCQKPKLKLASLVQAPPLGFLAISACASEFLRFTDSLEAAGAANVARDFTLAAFAPTFFFDFLRLAMGHGGKGKQSTWGDGSYGAGGGSKGYGSGTWPSSQNYANK